MHIKKIKPIRAMREIDDGIVHVFCPLVQHSLRTELAARPRR
jgi:hypothetical protein